MTIIDCCISLKMIKKVLVVLGVVDMRQLLLKVGNVFSSGLAKNDTYLGMKNNCIQLPLPKN